MDFVLRLRIQSEVVMITDFRISIKTKAPQCCALDCCGNKFGRIERSTWIRCHNQVNRIIKTRRYAKHVMKRMNQMEILQQLQDEHDDIVEAEREWELFWSDLDMEFES